MLWLTTCSSLYEAQALVDELERSGIPAVVANDNVHGTAGGIFAPVARIEVFISRPSDEPAARDLVASFRERSGSCPGCCYAT